MRGVRADHEEVALVHLGWDIPNNHGALSLLEIIYLDLRMVGVGAVEGVVSIASREE